MSEITMCNNEKCSIRHKCYRFMAIPCKYSQSYFAGDPSGDSSCEYYYKIEKGHCINEKKICHEKT